MLTIFVTAQPQHIATIIRLLLVHLLCIVYLIIMNMFTHLSYVDFLHVISPKCIQE